MKKSKANAVQEGRTALDNIPEQYQTKKGREQWDQVTQQFLNIYIGEREKSLGQPPLKEGQQVEWMTHILVCNYARNLKIKYMERRYVGVGLFDIKLENIQNNQFRNCFALYRVARVMWISILKKRRAADLLTNTLRAIPWYHRIRIKFKLYKKRLHTARALLATAALSRRYSLGRWMLAFNRFELLELQKHNGGGIDRRKKESPDSAKEVDDELAYLLTNSKLYTIATPLGHKDTLTDAKVSASSVQWDSSRACAELAKQRQNRVDEIREKTAASKESVPVTEAERKKLIRKQKQLDKRAEIAEAKRLERLLKEASSDNSQQASGKVSPRRKVKSPTKERDLTLLQEAEQRKAGDPVSSTLARWLHLYDDDAAVETHQAKRNTALGLEKYPVGSWTHTAAEGDRDLILPSTSATHENLSEGEIADLAASKHTVASSRVLYQFKRQVLTRRLQELREKRFEEWSKYQEALHEHKHQCILINNQLAARKKNVGGVFLLKKALRPTGLLKFPPEPQRYMNYAHDVYPSKTEMRLLRQRGLELQREYLVKESFDALSQRVSPEVSSWIKPLTAQESAAVESAQWMNLVRHSHTLEHEFVSSTMEGKGVPRVWGTHTLSQRTLASTGVDVASIAAPPPKVSPQVVVSPCVPQEEDLTPPSSALRAQEWRKVNPTPGWYPSTQSLFATSKRPMTSPWPERHNGDHFSVQGVRTLSTTLLRSTQQVSAKQEAEKVNQAARTPSLEILRSASENAGSNSPRDVSAVHVRSAVLASRFPPPLEATESPTRNRKRAKSAPKKGKAVKAPKKKK